MENGQYRAIFTKMNSVTLTACFLQYANRFTVVEPQALLYDVKNELEAAVIKYKK